MSALTETVVPDRDDTGRDVAWLADTIRSFAERIEPQDPTDAEGWVRLLRILFHAGRCDLPLGRLLEGHVDARQILARLGHAVEPGAIYGVWNAEAEGWRLTLDDNGLEGGKSFASGVDVLTHALVTTHAGTADVQLHLVDLERSAPTVDRTWWDVRGMARSRTHRVRWHDASATTVGGAGDYERPPWFFTGALRFAGVQAGGIAGLRDAVRDTLVAGSRAQDPIQTSRLSHLHRAAQSAVSVVLETGRALPDASEEAQKALVSNARNTVYSCAEEAMTYAARAIGTAAQFNGHPVSERLADLAMYIRQPGPDAQQARVGAAVADGSLDIVA